MTVNIIEHDLQLFIMNLQYALAPVKYFKYVYASLKDLNDNLNFVQWKMS